MLTWHSKCTGKGIEHSPVQSAWCCRPARGVCCSAAGGRVAAAGQVTSQPTCWRLAATNYACVSAAHSCCRLLHGLRWRHQGQRAPGVRPQLQAAVQGSVGGSGRAAACYARCGEVLAAAHTHDPTCAAHWVCCVASKGGRCDLGAGVSTAAATGAGMPVAAAAAAGPATICSSTG